jgi:hypothetical protein
MTDEYGTDNWLYYGMFDGWFDPCPLNANWEVDGLKIPWENQTFVNPPYSDPVPWIEKAIEERDLGGHTIALLLRHDTSTKWYRKLHAAGAHFLLINERLKHRTGRPCAFPSVLVILEAFEE